MSELLEKQTNKQQIKPPAKWNVVFVNDDFTTFEFVVICLMAVFNKSEEEAFALTRKVHEAGKAIITQLPKDIAETKREMAIALARSQEHPLVVDLEQSN